MCAQARPQKQKKTCLSPIFFFRPTQSVHRSACFCVLFFFMDDVEYEGLITWFQEQKYPPNVNKREDKKNFRKKTKKYKLHELGGENLFKKVKDKVYLVF